MRWWRGALQEDVRWLEVNGIYGQDSNPEWWSKCTAQILRCTIYVCIQYIYITGYDMIWYVCIYMWLAGWQEDRSVSQICWNKVHPHQGDTRVRSRQACCREKHSKHGVKCEDGRSEKSAVKIWFSWTWSSLLASMTLRKTPRFSRRPGVVGVYDVIWMQINRIADH